MLKNKIYLILQSLIFLIPINLYIIGDWLGSGIQTLFFRYHETTLGNSLIFLNREMAFVLNGTLSGKSAYASIIWCFGVILICIATLVILFAYFKEENRFINYGVFLNLGGALLFTIAIIIQYGITFHGPAGIAIPLGIPVILGVAYFQYRSAMNEIADDQEDEEVGENTLPDDSVNAEAENS
ncbi:MAG: hypothetical protein CVV32_09710 [Methanomicrobiales archaeon HGW-Methanomicrobiales-3]|jgi:hypothetical protein|nr:MAG: hypothetical protein CVV32_09710 [Methanomicrobiales archaeon HGW-Methanomicrobiales-3]